ncbi:hypothetical protein SAMN05421741_109104 [Paenimyroides ummariense]|uniref:Lipoprotein n=1 Tax=Paenimyroides ummariense TaxID=913024 RepID=A0A1I5B8M3_9FLAO|nr:hypothetical protein [Paenimyroides ummariense]SFN71037.1 hypothetical protein SAMN05421741_109104 [Paenimyroides ummariense]
MIFKIYYQNIVFLLSIILISSCSSNFDSKEYPIIYSSKNTQFNMLIYSGKFPIDEKLVFNEDKSYFYETCSLNEKGTWKIKGDSLFLFCQEKGFKNENLYKIDSLKQVIICRKTPTIWIIKSNRIKQVDRNLLLFE